MSVFFKYNSLYVISSSPERFIKRGERWLQRKKEKPRKIQLESGRQLPGKSLYIISLCGIKDRSAAESLVGETILVPSNDRPKLSKDEFHLMDLMNLKVKLMKDGSEIVQVIDLKSLGNDLLEIQLIEGKKILVPFVKEIVPEVNLNEGWLKISPPSGLLEL